MSGDARTPDKTIGQIKCADGQEKGTDKEARRVVEGGEADKKEQPDAVSDGRPGPRMPRTMKSRKRAASWSAWWATMTSLKTPKVSAKTNSGPRGRSRPERHRSKTRQAETPVETGGGRSLRSREESIKAREGRHAERQQARRLRAAVHMRTSARSSARILSIGSLTRLRGLPGADHWITASYSESPSWYTKRVK